MKVRAKMAVDDLAHWPVDRISHISLSPLAWQYYRNVSAYDAFYVAAARAHGLPDDSRRASLAGAGFGCRGTARPHRVMRPVR